MTLYTVIGDPHAKPDNLDKINTLFDIIEDLGNECIILGDLLDTKEVVRGKCLNTYINRISGSKLHFNLLVGNHDWFNLQCEEHSLEPLRHLRNAAIIDSHIIHKALAFAPFTSNLELFREWVLKSKDKTLFCHADIFGFDYGNGHISDHGLTLKDFKDVKQVISGHYHAYQKKDNVIYLGTPFSHSFGESNQIKYIGLWDSETGELELLESPFPKHVTIELNCGSDALPNIKAEDYNRVILTGTQEQINKVPKTEGVRYIERPSEASRVIIVDETQSPEVQFSKWAKDIKGYSAEIVKTGLEILSNVSKN